METRETPEAEKDAPAAKSLIRSSRTKDFCLESLGVCCSAAGALRFRFWGKGFAGFRGLVFTWPTTLCRTQLKWQHPKSVVARLEMLGQY